VHQVGDRKVKVPRIPQECKTSSPVATEPLFQYRWSQYSQSQSRN